MMMLLLPLALQMVVPRNSSRRLVALRLLAPQREICG